VRHPTGVPVPTFISPDGNYDLWGWITDSTFRDFKFLIIQNISLWLILYVGAYALTHLEPQASIFRPLKFNKKYPKLDLVAKEFCRSVRGVFIATAYEACVHKQYASSALPIVHLDWLQVGTDAPIGRIVLSGLLMYLWGDAHFYWTHRLLHTSWLY
jgi:sterol desaturase/sphingolipid hydroxylase (fatty acid hydroxylase superfamily)